MITTPGEAVTRAALTELPEQQRQRAFDRYQTLRPHLEQDVSLGRVAAAASMPLRTAQRWVNRYRRFGLAGLTRAGRADQGKRRRLSAELCRFAEGLALQRPPFGPGAIYREVCRVAREKGQDPPGYHTVTASSGPSPKALVHEGAASGVSRSGSLIRGPGRRSACRAPSSG
jgi:putative transposase